MANILVIDQDAAVRGLFQTVLESAWHAVALAANADEGYEVLRSSRIEMAIVDINMSNGTGLERSSRLSNMTFRQRECW